MYARIIEGLKSAPSFAASCRDLEQELVRLSLVNKKQFFSCFDAATVFLGREVPLSFAPMLISPLARAGDLGKNPVFAPREYESLRAWKNACECVAEGKRMRRRNDGRFGSEKTKPKPAKKFRSDVRVTEFRRLSEVKLWRESRSAALKRVAKTFEGNDEVTVSDVLVSLVCPLGLARMTVPGRTRECEHLSCFDVENFAKMAETQKNFETRCPECRSKRKWSATDILIDPIFEDILDETSPETKRARLFRDGKWEAITEKKEAEELSDSDSGETLLRDLLKPSSEPNREYIDLT